MTSSQAILLICAVGSSFGAETTKITIDATHWKTDGKVEFLEKDGRAAIELKPGASAILNDFTFRNGTIEYDVEATGSMGAGIAFRQRDKNTYEEFYLRPRPNCNAAPDCIQYAPETHGVLLWDMFPQYQSPAPLKDSGWNHIKLVVSGSRMNVFVNDATAPTLRIGRLEGDALEGGLMFQGPGIFANLAVTPDAVDGLSPKPEQDPTASDIRYLRHWQLAPYSTLAVDHQPAFADMPGSDAAWRPIAAERAGLVNVSREFGVPLARPERGIVWLKTTINSTKDQTKQVDIGWSRELWVFVNGKQVYADKNLYQPPSARKVPDGRCSLENGSFALPLKAGTNEVVAAVANNFYGWGIILRLQDTKDISLDEK